MIVQTLPLKFYEIKLEGTCECYKVAIVAMKGTKVLTLSTAE